MFLHSNKELFESLIVEIAAATDIEEAIIEKDYFVTLFLERLTKREPLLVFKGGTCLSKCFKLIERFSEDVDVNLEDVRELSQARRKQFKEHIESVIADLGLTLSNPERIKSGMDYNLYEVTYPALFSSGSLKQYLQIESVFRINAFPTEKRSATSIVYDYLIKNNGTEIIQKYSLEPFDVKVQTLQRTFVDKVFAVCDYYLDGRIKAHSRHLYDLYKILPHITLDKTLYTFFEDVRLVREGKKDCPSAAPDLSLPTLLNAIIKEQTYKSDYEDITQNLLYEEVTYEQTIKSLQKIIAYLEKQGGGN